MGGPGLNLGLQDTINLGWKLAAEIQGWAPDGLLDTYESERRPVGERVVMHTQAQSALIAPGKEITALRQLFTELLDNPMNVQHLADLMSGADIRYGEGGGHPLVGKWAPDLVIADASGRSTRLAELTRTARPLLIDLTNDSVFAELLADVDRIEVVAGHGADPGQPVALLIRPDGYVAWAADADGPGEREALGDALARWFAVRVQRPLTKATR
jgi:hypothetical protein